MAVGGALGAAVTFEEPVVLVVFATDDTASVSVEFVVEGGVGVALETAAADVPRTRVIIELSFSRRALRSAAMFSAMRVAFCCTMNDCDGEPEADACMLRFDISSDLHIRASLSAPPAGARAACDEASREGGAEASVCPGDVVEAAIRSRELVVEPTGVVPVERSRSYSLIHSRSSSSFWREKIASSARFHTSFAIVVSKSGSSSSGSDALNVLRISFSAAFRLSDEPGEEDRADPPVAIEDSLPFEELRRGEAESFGEPAIGVFMSAGSIEGRGDLFP